MSTSSPTQQGGSSNPAPQQGQTQSGTTPQQQGSTTKQPVFRDWAAI